MKIVINSCWGGFGLSEQAVARYAELKVGKLPKHWYVGDLERNDPLLVQVVEELGEENASGELSKLRIVEIPDDIEWGIHEYDGMEYVEEIHRTWT